MKLFKSTMPNHINAASRLHTLFSQLNGHTDNTQVLSGWVQTFSIDEPMPKRQAIEVARRLDAVSKELSLVRTAMSKGSFSAPLYEDAISCFEEAVSPMLLPHTWSIVRQYLTPKNLLSLRFCSEILPDEESQVMEEDISAILSLVTELREAAHGENVPNSLRLLLLHHVDLIERAMGEYPISGVKALREAAQAGLGELIELKEIIADHSKSEEITKLAKVWKKVGQVADVAIKSEKIIQVGHKAWELIESVWSNRA